MFSNPFPDAHGIDIGDLSIKLVQLRNVSARKRKPSFKFVTAKTIDLPEGLIVNGELQQPEKVRHYIHHLLDEEGKKGTKEIRSPWTVASLPETQGYLKLITIMKPYEEILLEDVLHAAKKHIPFDEATTHIDWQIIPRTRNRDVSDVLITVTPKFLADSYTYLLESVGLNVIALENESVAISRSMIQKKHARPNTAQGILDLGHNHTSFVIHDHGRIQMSISFQFSGRKINQALVQAFHISDAEAEQLKRDVGLVYKKKYKQAWTIIKQEVDELVSDIQKAVRFYRAHHIHSNPMAHIALCGGGAKIKKLDHFLSLKLQTVCEVGNPWQRLGLAQHIPIKKDGAAQYATAVGLALRASDNIFVPYDDI